MATVHPAQRHPHRDCFVRAQLRIVLRGATYLALRTREERSMVGDGDNTMRVVRPVILLLENDSNDAFLFRRAVARLGYRGTIRIVSGVSEARSYLEGTGSHADGDYDPRPDLIVCDMALGSTGNEFLEWFRGQPSLRQIPVVMLSGSSLPKEKERACHLGAKAFYQKTGDITELTRRMREALTFLPEEK